MTRQTDVINGYIAGEKNAPDVFPTKRVIEVRAYCHQGVYYFKTRDISDLLGMKQPFKFSMMCREYLGEGSILNGEATLPFRSKNDSARETFISAADLQAYLLSDTTSKMQKYAPGMYERVLESLTLYL